MGETPDFKGETLGLAPNSPDRLTHTKTPKHDCTTARMHECTKARNGVSFADAQNETLYTGTHSADARGSARDVASPCSSSDDPIHGTVSGDSPKSAEDLQDLERRCHFDILWDGRYGRSCVKSTVCG